MKAILLLNSVKFGLCKRVSRAAWVNEKAAVFGLKLRFRQWGLYLISLIRLSLIASVWFGPRGPNGIVQFAKGPVVTQPPPVPSSVVRLKVTLLKTGGRSTREKRVGGGGMNTPSPPKLYGEPSKRGEAVRFPPSRNQFQYLVKGVKHARLFEGYQKDVFVEGNLRKQALIAAFLLKGLFKCPYIPSMPAKEWSLGTPRQPNSIPIGKRFISPDKRKWTTYIEMNEISLCYV